MHDVGTRRPRRWTTLVGGAALALTLAGCGTASTAAPAATVSTPPTTTGDIAAAIHLADLQNVHRPDTVFSAGATPTFTLVDDTAKMTPLHGTNTASWGPGDYLLVVRCIGTGSLTAELQVGEYLTWLDLPGCSSTSSPGIVALTVPRRGTGMSVTITPNPGTRAAVAYQVRRQPS